MKRDEINKKALIRALDHMQGTFSIFDRDGHYVFYNTYTRDSLEVTDQIMEDFTIGEMVEQGYLSVSASQETLRTGRSTIKYSIYHNGMPFLIVSTPMMDESGQVEYAVAYSIDERLLSQISKEMAEAQQESLKLLQSLTDQGRDSDVICASRPIQELLAFLDRVVKIDSTILFTGETGVGKDVLANYVHRHSNRSGQVFIPVNCAAIPESLMESEFFGYSEGTFTGGQKNGKPGIFELAKGGTIFLDEIGEMPLAVQAKLLRVLETHTVTRLGSVETKEVDFRLVVATNRDLRELCREKKFREDLYYRINTLEVEIPPLRARKADILPLANHFLARLNKKYHTEKVFSRRTMYFFEAYTWPGNVRQLKNEVERLLITTPGEIIEYDQIPGLSGGYLQEAPVEHGSAGQEEREAAEQLPLKEAMRRAEKRYILSVLDQCQGSVSKAAELLQVHRTGLYKKLRSYAKGEL